MGWGGGREARGWATKCSGGSQRGPGLQHVTQMPVHACTRAAERGVKGFLRGVGKGQGIAGVLSPSPHLCTPPRPPLPQMPGASAHPPPAASCKRTQSAATAQAILCRVRRSVAAYGSNRASHPSIRRHPGTALTQAGSCLPPAPRLRVASSSLSGTGRTLPHAGTMTAPPRRNAAGIHRLLRVKPQEDESLTKLGDLASGNAAAKDGIKVATERDDPPRGRLPLQNLLCRQRTCKGGVPQHTVRVGLTCGGSLCSVKEYNSAEHTGARPPAWRRSCSPSSPATGPCIVGSATLSTSNASSWLSCASACRARGGRGRAGEARLRPARLCQPAPS